MSNMAKTKTQPAHRGSTGLRRARQTGSPSLASEQRYWRRKDASLACAAPVTRETGSTAANQQRYWLRQYTPPACRKNNCRLAPATAADAAD